MQFLIGCVVGWWFAHNQLTVSVPGAVVSAGAQGVMLAPASVNQPVTVDANGNVVAGPSVTSASGGAAWSGCPAGQVSVTTPTGQLSCIDAASANTYGRYRGYRS